MALLTAPAIARPPEAIEVEEWNSPSEFAALRKDWNALVESSGAGPFNRHECIGAWINSFARGAKLVILTARDPEKRLIAALPLLLERGLVCGLPARQLVATANTHSCRFDLIATDATVASRAFLRHLLDKPGWEVLRISDVPEGGYAWQLHHAAVELRLPVGAWESQRSPYLALPSTYEELLAGKSVQFRANLRRRRRQIERLGRLTFERVTTESKLLERLDEGFELERRGWKGRAGTAIAQDGATRAFYTELAAESARNGRLCLSFLRIDGRPIAFHFGLIDDGVYYVPKLAYDEALKGCSPGLVLLEEAIKHGIADGLHGYDFLGAEAEWKTRWSSSAKPHHWLYIFRDSGVGHALHRAKFDLVPLAKKALSGVEKIWGAA
jgi:CelD/BcsL family acetyltransferase involved in cellulose biosynthesis